MPHPHDRQSLFGIRKLNDERGKKRGEEGGVAKSFFLKRGPKQEQRTTFAGNGKAAFPAAVISEDGTGAEFKTDKEG